MFLSEFSQPGLIASMLACQNDSILLWVVNNLFQDGNPEGWLSRKVLASLKALWELVMVQSLRWWIPLKLWQRCLSHSPVAMPGMNCMPHPWNLVLHSSTRVKILPHPNLSQTHNPCPSLPCRIWFCLLCYCHSLVCAFYQKKKHRLRESDPAALLLPALTSASTWMSKHCYWPLLQGSLLCWLSYCSESVYRNFTEEAWEKTMFFTLSSLSERYILYII